MTRSPFEPDHVRASDTARDLDVPPISANPHANPDNGAARKSRLCAVKTCANIAPTRGALCKPHARELERLMRTRAPAA